MLRRSVLKYHLHFANEPTRKMSRRKKQSANSKK
ncbi:rCG59488, partial [Rattus norvegicus]